MKNGFPQEGLNFISLFLSTYYINRYQRFIAFQKLKFKNSLQSPHEVFREHDVRYIKPVRKLMRKPIVQLYTCTLY